MEFDVLALGFDTLTMAGGQVFQGVLIGRQPTGLTTYVLPRNRSGSWSEQAAGVSGVVLSVSRSHALDQPVS